MKEISIKKGHILQQPGELNTKVYNVKSGLLRAYTIDNKGKEHIYMFAPEQWTISDATLAIDKSDLYIDALENSTLEVLEKQTEVNPNDGIRLIRRFAVMQKRIIMLMSATAYERYNHFIATYPNIVQRVPQRMIASYLGVTPEALSRSKKDNL